MPAQDVSLTGGCFCGAVTYRVAAPLRAARACHCSRCRKAFSGAGSAYAEVEPGSFSWTATTPTIYPVAGPWGMAFCGTCGTTLAGVVGDDVHGVTLGSVDGDPGIQIAWHQFTGSKAPWDHIGGDAPQHDEAPPT
jgi:hypothetical protein